MNAHYNPHLLLQVLSDLFCISPFFYLSVSQSLPTLFQLSIHLHTHSINSSPLLHFLPIKGSGSRREHLSIKGRVCWGGGFKRTVNPADTATHVHKRTSSQSFKHCGLKHRSRGQAAEVILITSVHVLSSAASFLCSTKPSEEHNSKGQTCLSSCSRITIVYNESLFTETKRDLPHFVIKKRVYTNWKRCNRKKCKKAWF